jgi:predicted phosphohydrolase
LNALFQSAQSNDAKETYLASIAEHTLFMRENEKLINQVCSCITDDSEIESLRKTKDARVLKIFTTSLLMVHGPETSNDHTNDSDLNDLLNSAKLLFHEDCVDRALQLVLDKIITIDSA